MKRFLLTVSAAAALLAACRQVEPDPTPVPPGPIDPVLETVASGITYQLLVYSFADSDGDGCGDFKGIESKLSYLSEMGVQALWLSPIHPATSYHGYDVKDYSTVNPDYGTEADFKHLLDAAHSLGIKVYIDYVLNHSSKDHPWFVDALKSESSPYRDYYFIAEKPYLDGTWTQVTTGSSGKMAVKFTLVCDSSDRPSTLTISKVGSVQNSGTQTSGKWLWWGDGNCTQFYSTGSKTYTLSLELESSWGVLVRTSTTQWDSYKYGAPSGASALQWDKPFTLTNSSAGDIPLPGMNSMYYYSVFGSYMPDLNYGSAATCETSGAFKSVTEAADKWIGMGVDGFRLDAVKHIYTNASSDENPTFLKKFYDHCNTTYKAAGHTDDIYMVGEHFSEPNEVAPYYKGIPAFFEFAFWWRLKDAINGGDGSALVGQIQSYQKLYAQYRNGWIEATKLSNHDEDRAGSDFGRNTAKMKLAAAVLLTCSGEPYIYQGEELGYWGTKSGGDEYVRTPILWTSSTTSAATGKLGGKVDNSMLTSAMSVASQSADKESVLSVYRKFGTIRTTYKALAKGTLGYCAAASGTKSVCAYYREYDGQKILVVHNFGASVANINFTSDKLTDVVATNGSATVSGTKLTLGAYSTAVFLQ